MNKELGLKLAETFTELEGKLYLEAMIVFASAPTIEGKKPSSLMSFNRVGKNTASLWKKYGEEICSQYNLEFFQLRENDENILVLLYRRKLLEWYVNHNRNITFLTKMGYSVNDQLETKLEILKQRFEKLCPHEVGVFLGMPVEDVEGFIEHQGKNCLMCRYWKVYGSTQRAERLFNAYDKARATMAQYVISLSDKRFVECI